MSTIWHIKYFLTFSLLVAIAIFFAAATKTAKSSMTKVSLIITEKAKAEMKNQVMLLICYPSTCIYCDIVHYVGFLRKKIPKWAQTLVEPGRPAKVCQSLLKSNEIPLNLHPIIHLFNHVCTYVVIYFQILMQISSYKDKKSFCIGV